MSSALKPSAAALRALRLPLRAASSSAPSTSSARAFSHSPPARAGARAGKKSSGSSKKGSTSNRASLAAAAAAEAAATAGRTTSEVELVRPLAEAFNLLRAWEITRPFAGISLAVQVAPDKAKPSMRGRTLFARDPATKPDVVYVFCKGADVARALEAGAAQAGGEELFEKLMNGSVPLPTACLATPALVPALTENRQLTRFLGPKGLLPQLKRGTVVDDVAQAVQALKGVLDWRVSRQNLLQAAVARTNFTPAEIEANVLRLLHDLRMCGTAAASFDGEGVHYTEIKRVALTSTNGPEIVLSDVMAKLALAHKDDN